MELPFHLWVNIGLMLSKKKLIQLATINKYTLNLTKIILLIKLRKKIWFHLLEIFKPFGIKNIYKFKEDFVNLIDYMLEDQILLLGYDHFNEYNFNLCISQINIKPKYIQFIHDNNYKNYKKYIIDMYKLIVFNYINKYYPYLLFYYKAIKNNICYY
jgi:hypothetical protein